MNKIPKHLRVMNDTNECDCNDDTSCPICRDESPDHNYDTDDYDCNED